MKKFLLFLLLLLVPQILPAQADTVNFGKIDSTILEEIVISSGQFEQRLAEVPVSLDILKPALIQDKNLTQLEAALAQAPGVNVTEGQANIRSGSGWTFGAGTRVQTLVDGMPLISGDAAQVKWDLVPLFSAEQIEVLKGAASVLYGSAALNGVINVITNPFPEKEKFQTNLYGKVYDAPSRKSLKWWDSPPVSSGFNFGWQKPLTERSGLLLSGGFKNERGFQYLDDDRRAQLFGKYFWKPRQIKNLDLSLAAHFLRKSNASFLLWESDSLGYIPQDSNITRSTGWDFYIDPQATFRHGKFRHTLQGRFLQTNNNASNQTEDFFNRSDYYFGQYYLQYFLEKVTFTSGFLASKTTSVSLLFDGNHLAKNYAGFLQMDAKPLKWLNLNGGFRYEKFRLDEREDAQPVFRFGANAQVFRGLSVRTSYGEAFRFPSVAESFTTTSVGAFNIFPNPELQAESGRTWEVGVRQMLFKKPLSSPKSPPAPKGGVATFRGYADLAFFQMEFQNMIEYNAGFWRRVTNVASIGRAFGFLPINIGNTTIQGVEAVLAVEGSFGQDWDFRFLGGYTFADPKIQHPETVFATDSAGNEKSYQTTISDTLSSSLKYRYQHLIKMDAQIGYKNWEFGFSLRYNDFMENVDRIFVDFVDGVEENRERQNGKGDLILDARIGYGFSQKWRVDFLAENLGNREVMTRPALLGPPRSFQIRVGFRM